MGLFGALGEALGGAVDVGLGVAKTAYHVVDLDVDSAVNQVDKTVNRTAETIENIADEIID